MPDRAIATSSLLEGRTPRALVTSVTQTTKTSHVANLPAGLFSDRKTVPFCSYACSNNEHESCLCGNTLPGVRGALPRAAATGLCPRAVARAAGNHRGLRPQTRPIGSAGGLTAPHHQARS